MIRTKFLQALAVMVFSVFLSVNSYAEFKLGLVLDKGGKDDKSFNASAYKGANEAKSKLKVSLKVVEAMDNNAFETLLRAFAKKDFDLIIAVGLAQSEALKKIAPQFPDKKFAIVDAQVDAPNVRSLLFEEHEGSYLVGALAAMASKSGKIGFIGGMDIPLIRRFELGYLSGAQKINSKIQLISNFVGVTGDAWNNPAKAKELALSQYSSGVDVIFAAAGASGNGLFDAAEEKSKFAIGVDSNQNWIKPGKVLTSMLKRVDVAVYSTTEDATKGKFSPGVIRYGLANEGIDYALDEHNKPIVTAEMQAKVNQLKKEIMGQKIVVPDFYKKAKK